MIANSSQFRLKNGKEYGMIAKKEGSNVATICILGSCAGTEPMPNRNHTSWTLSVGDKLYFFDTGECCSWTAHRLGLDLLQTRAIFISHVHHDHTAGLAGLMENIRALIYKKKMPLATDDLQLYIPELDVWENVYQFLKYTTDGHKTAYTITAEEPKPGVFYNDGAVKVSAFETLHMKKTEDGRCRSFAYRIETEGKTIVFSGDIRELAELTPVIGEGCDVLLCETGHHSVKAVCDFAENAGVKKLVFVHNGREILNGKPTVREAIDNCAIAAVISEDGMRIEV